MARKLLMEFLPTNLPDLEYPCPICLLTKATKMPRGTTIDVSKISPGFMLHMDLSFFNVEIICVLTSSFAAMCSATSYTFVFPSRRKRPSLYILIFSVITLRNQDKKFSFIWVDKYRELAISSEFMKTRHSMNIIVQTTGGD